MRKHLIAFLFLITIISGQEKFPKRELRGAWIATVKNIDWPSSKYLTSGEQLKELITIFDKLHAAGINSVFFQIRSECDALYKSNYEPWSYWLTGEQGKAPQPYYDPLEFAISEAHNRGMELHAWFNPYRTFSNTEPHPAAKNHILNTHPEWILQFGTLKILNPGLPEVTEYLNKIVDDVLSRYDVDGIHFDDYFYPYTPITDQDVKTFEKYKGSFTDINDWRRNNINTMISGISNNIKIKKPWVKFGVSPFGIIKNNYAGTNGFESYHVLYNDPLTWINEKTVDYILPQIYWEIGHNKADFAKLLPWWASVADDRHLYIGHFATRIAGEDYKGKKNELGNQLRMNRKSSGVKGQVYFSAKAIFNNYTGLADSMKSRWFRHPALLPAMSWKDTVAPLPPEKLLGIVDSAGISLDWEAPNDTTIMYYILYRFKAKEDLDINDVKKLLKIIPKNKTSFHDNYGIEINKEYSYCLTSVDRLYNESLPISLTIKYERLKKRK